MKFDFVVCRFNGKEELILGGFLTLKKAKFYAESRDADFLTEGFLFVDCPEGIYVLGETESEETLSKRLKATWFAPREQAFVYSGKEDRLVKVDKDCIKSIFK